MRSVMTVALCGVWLAACGGPQKAGEGGGGEEKPVAKGSGDTMASPEALEAIDNYFRHRVIQVQTCYSSAVRDGKLSRKANGQVTLELTISTAAKLDGVHIANTSLNSKEVEDCLVKMVKGFNPPAPDAPVNFSFTYSFHAE